MARTYGFDSEPDAQVLERLNNPKRAYLFNEPALRTYLRRRLREERVSLYRLCEVTGWTRALISKALNRPSASCSLERLETILYIVDGGTERWLKEQDGIC